MNSSLWQLAAWTMIHSLWIGGAIALVGATLRVACRRARPNARYALSLATLAAFALTPIATAAWLSVNGVPLIESALLPPPGGEGWGGGQQLVHAPNHPSLTFPLEGRGLEKNVERAAPPVVIDLAHSDPSPRYSGESLGEGSAQFAATPSVIATTTNPSPNPSLPGWGTTPPLPTPQSPFAPSPPASSRQSPITSRLISLLPTLWLIGAPLTFILLAAGLIGSERLRRRATPLTAGPAYDACQRLRHTLKISRRVALNACDEIAQPILVGIIRPLILLPTAALAGWTPAELEMVLLHELAHVRRWDNLVNLLQRIVESVLFFHPAVWLLSRQVRRDREECCDATVVARIAEPTHYAELLVTIASRSRLNGRTPSLAVASAMATHPLAGRIRRILNLEEEPMRITRRALAATLLLPLLLAGAIFYSGANAENSPAPQRPESTPLTDAQTEAPSDQAEALAINLDLSELDHPLAQRLKSQEGYVNQRISQEQSLRNEPSRPIEDVIAAEFLTDRAISSFERMLEEPAGNEEVRQATRKMLSDLQSLKNRLAVQRQEYRKAVEEAIRKRLDSRKSNAIYADLVANRLVNVPPTPQAQSTTTAKVSEFAASPQAPLLDRLEQLRAAFDAHRSDFETSLDSPLQKVTYEGDKLLEIVDDHWHYLVKGIGNEKGKPPIAFNWTRLGGKKYEIEVPAEAHKRLFGPLFLGTLPTVKNASQPHDVLSSEYAPPFAAGFHEVIQEFAADAAMQDIQTVDNKLKAEGRKVGVESHIDGRKRIVDLARPIKQQSPSTSSSAQGGEATGNSADKTASVAEASGVADTTATPAPSLAVITSGFAFQEGLPGAPLELRKLRADVRYHMLNELKERHKNGPGAIETTRAVLLTDRALLELELYLKQQGALKNPSPSQLAALRTTAADLEKLRAALKSERQAAPHSIQSASAAAPSPFPTFEQQRIADRAYRLFGVDFEPLRPAELARVKKLGYAGGVRVGKNEGGGSNLPPEDLLVGLHAWPVTSMESLGAILDREDLGELTPLKFYVIRNPERDQFGGVDPAKDKVVTGRLEMFRDVLAALQEEKLRRQSVDLESAKAVATTPNGPIPANSDVPTITVVQPPNWSINGPTKNHSQTTAYLKIKFDRPTTPFTDADARPTPQEIERQAMNYIALIQSPVILTAAINAAAPQEVAVSPNDHAVELFRRRLTATFPGDGEIMELKLTGGQENEDPALLQAIIDAFIKSFTKSSEANLTAQKDGPPGDLDQYIATAVTEQPKPITLKSGDQVNLKVAGAFPEAPIDGPFVIEPEGTIALGPHYGRVAIAGKTVSDAEAAVLEHLGKTLTEVAVQLTLNTSQPSTPSVRDEATSSTTFLYDGKTFEQWRELWKLELNPERRTEAINALAAFGRAGRGQETADAILEVADEYSETHPNGPAEQKLFVAIDEAVSRMPAEQWMPQVLERIRSSEDWRKDVWRRRATQFLSTTRDARPEARTLAAKFAEDEKLLGPVSYYLLKNDQELSDPLTVEFVRKAWKSDGERGDLLNLLGFRRLDLVPEQLDDVLRRADARRYLASLVAHNPDRTKEVVATLLAASKERENVDDRIGALRAIKTLGDSLNARGNHQLNREVAEYLLEIVKNGPDETLPAAIAAYGRVLNNTPPQDVPAKLKEWKKISDERAAHLFKFAQAYDEFNAE